MKSGEVVAGRYRLVSRLGVGGMGEVWKATHEGTGREFALKFMHAHAATSASARQRFAREARVSAKINHPNVIDIFDAGEHDEGTLFLAMELLDGISLGDALHLTPPLSVQDLLVVMLDTTCALAAAHAVGIVHRDIKPANIFLHRDRASGFASAKILDFGISKFGGNDDSHHTKTGAVLGSPRYMSPEQTRSAADVDHRSDVWACGVILFEALAGTWPHEGDSFSSLVVAICTTPPTSIDRVAPDLPFAVRSIVRDCLQPLDQRIKSAAELGDRLGVALQDPTLAQRQIARPLHPPSESIRVTTGVRIRPLGTTGVFEPDTLRTAAPESLRTTQSRSRLADAPAPPPAELAPAPAAPPDDEAPDLETRRILPELVAAALAAAPPQAQAPPARSSPGEMSPFAAGMQLPSAATMSPPPARSSPGAPSPFAMGTIPITAASRTAEPAPDYQPEMPLFKGHLKTVPLPAGAIMHAELARLGLVPGAASSSPAPSDPAPDPGAAPPDPLAGTLDTLATTAVREPPGAGPARPSARPATPSTAPVPPAQPRPASGLRLVAAALSLLLVGIVIALVAVLRSGPAESKGSAAPRPVPSAAPSPEHSAERPLPPTAPPPAVEPTVAATDTPIPSATISAAPVERPRPTPPRPPPPRGSKVKQLGSGL